MRRHQQNTALSAIGLLPESPGFPAVVNCPLCKQLALHIFDDESTENIWLYCNECSAAGDIITFGAAIWNMPIAETLAKFAEIKAICLDDPSVQDEYLAVLAQRDAAQSFWKTAQDSLWECQDDEIACRLRELGVLKETGGTPLVGVATYEKITEFAEQTNRRVPVSMLHRPGIVFPYQTFPGVFSGFLIAQYDETASQQVFIPLSAARRRPEAGYFLIQAALQPQTQVLKNTQYIVADPFWALKQQYMQRKYGLPMLPLMAAYYGNEARSYGKSWGAFSYAQRIFHAGSHTPEVISCACNARGYVAVSHSLRNKPHRSNPTITTLAHIKRRADTWRGALTAALTHMSELAAYSFLTKLTISPEKIATFLAGDREHFSQNFGDKVLAAITQKRIASPAKQDRFTVIERDGAWVSAAGRQICAGLVRVHEVIYTDKNEKFYKCSATCKDTTIEFTDTAAKIETTGLLEYAAKKFAEQGLLFAYDRRWNLTAHSRAISLHEPQMRYSVGELGWNETAQIFHLGGYDFDTDGTARESVLLPTAQIKQSFPEPLLALPSGAYKFLTPSYENSFNWLAFATFVNNVVAPVLNEAPAAVAVSGQNFCAISDMWRALGAESLELTYAHSNHTNDRVREKTKAINWPLCAANIFDDSLASYSVLHCHNRPLLLRLTPEALSVAPGYGWLALMPPTLPVTDNFSVFQYVLPMYVQHILKNRLRRSARTPLVLDILRDLSNWLQSNTGTTFNIMCAENSVFTQKDAHIMLAGELRRAVNNGAIDVLPRPRRKDQPKNYLLQQKTTWWLNRRAIDSYFKTHRSVPPNWPEIVNLLAENNVAVEAAAIHEMPGYYVSRAWCDDYIVGESAHKKIIGG